MSRSPNTPSRSPKSKPDHTGNCLTLIGILIAAAALVATAYFGCLALQCNDPPPPAAQIVPPTATEPPAATKPVETQPPPPGGGTVLFFEDFESASLDFDDLSESWEVRSDPVGNHYFCLLTRGDGTYGQASKGYRQGWSRYQVEFDGLVSSADMWAAVQVLVHYGGEGGTAFLASYEHYFNTEWTSISRKAPVEAESIVLDSMNRVLLPGAWTRIRVVVDAPRVSVFRDDELLFDVENGNFIPEGFIRFLTAGQGEYCLDNIRVSELEP